MSNCGDRSATSKHGARRYNFPMGSLGVHFALDEGQRDRLLAASNDDEVMAAIQAIEEAWDKDHVGESDKAWDAIHRCLTDGSLDDEAGEFPLSHVVLGGRQLHQGEDFIVAFVSVDEVKVVAKALLPLTKDTLKGLYFTMLDRDDYGPEFGDADFAYTWDWFENVRELFLRASINGRSVIFTVDL
jgi:Domain of unknown function (DUF1877)